MKITEKDGIKRLLLVLLPILLLAIGVGAWALLSRKPEKHKPAPQMPADSTVSLTYSDAVSIHLADARVTLGFTNPANSAWDTSVRLVIAGVVMAQSEVVSPGGQVTELALASGADTELSAGSCDGRLLVSFYYPQTQEKAMLDAEIPVDVTVTE